MLDINSKKTKVMIIQKRAKKTSDLEWHIGKQTINIVHEYTDLRIQISSTGHFNASLEKELKPFLRSLLRAKKHRH